MSASLEGNGNSMNDPKFYFHTLKQIDTTKQVASHLLNSHNPQDVVNARLAILNLESAEVEIIENSHMISSTKG